MSTYQYYEFCKIASPLTTEAKKEMNSLSSRAKVGTHGASYVYNYGDFRGNPKKLLLKYFDVFFYISNWGCIQLMFKYAKQDFFELDKLKRYCIKHIVDCEVVESHILLNVNFRNEDGFGWVEGEGMLSDLLPLYDEIKSKNYQFLQLVAEAQSTPTNSPIMKNLGLALSEAQEAFFKYAEVDQKEFYE